MRTIIMTLLALTGSVAMLAQQNPKQGYIITNANDTIYGTIDYRTEARNAKECLFKADGSDAFVGYKPTDIRAYRFSDNGSFFVSKTFAVDGKAQTFFAEYLLQGGVSLFCHSGENGFSYFLEGEDGQVVEVKDDMLGVTDTKSEYAEKMKQRRQTMASVPQIFPKDIKTCQDLWMMEFSPNKLTQLVRRYDETYCTEAGDCVEFQYNEKKRRSLKARFWALAGARFDNLKVTNDPTDYTATVPQLSLGTDLYLPQYSKHLFMQVGLSLSRFDFPKTDQYKKNGTGKLTATCLETLIGVGYSVLPDQKVNPYIVADASLLGQLFLPKMKRAYSWGSGGWDEDTDSHWGCSGYRVGIGVDIVKIIRVEVAYRKSLSNLIDTNGICLTAGVCL